MSKEKFIIINNKKFPIKNNEVDLKSIEKSTSNYKNEFKLNGEILDIKGDFILDGKKINNLYLKAIIIENKIIKEENNE